MWLTKRWRKIKIWVKSAPGTGLLAAPLLFIALFKIWVKSGKKWQRSLITHTHTHTKKIFAFSNMYRFTSKCKRVCLCAESNATVRWLYTCLRVVKRRSWTSRKITIRVFSSIVERWSLITNRKAGCYKFPLSNFIIQLDTFPRKQFPATMCLTDTSIFCQYRKGSGFGDSYIVTSRSSRHRAWVSTKTYPNTGTGSFLNFFQRVDDQYYQDQWLTLTVPEFISWLTSNRILEINQDRMKKMHFDFEAREAI